MSIPVLETDSRFPQAAPSDDEQWLCSKCGDELEYPGEQICPACRRAENPEGELRAIGIPSRYLASSLDNFSGNNDLVGYVRQLVTGEPRSVFLTGPTGCGKTHLATAMVRNLVQQNRITRYNARFVSTVDLLIEAKATFGQAAGRSEEDVLVKYARPPLLILDDLGAEKQSDWAATLLYALIDRRYRDLKITFITSNMDLEAIEQQLGSRTASRLAEYEIVKIRMPDHRKQSAQQEIAAL
jgi:DNA replication protein DnaC